MAFLFRRMEAGSPKPPGKATKRSKGSGVAQRPEKKTANHTKTITTP